MLLSPVVGFALSVLFAGGSSADESVLAPLRAVDESRRALPFADVSIVSRKEVYIPDGGSGVNGNSTKSLKDAVVNYRILTDGQRALVKYDQVRPNFKSSPRMSNAWAYDGKVLRIDRWGQRSDPSGSDAILGEEWLHESGASLPEIRTKYGLSFLIDYRYFGIWNYSLGDHCDLDVTQAERKLSDRIEESFAHVCRLPGFVSSVRSSKYGSTFTQLVIESTIECEREKHQSAIRHLIDIDLDRRVVVRYETQCAKTIEALKTPDWMELTESEWGILDFEGKSHLVPKQVSYTKTIDGVVIDRETSDVTVKFIDPTDESASSFSWAALEMQPGNHVRFEDGNVQQWDGHQFGGLPPIQSTDVPSSGSSGVRLWWPVVNVLLICGFLSFCFVTRNRRLQRGQSSQSG